MTHKHTPVRRGLALSAVLALGLTGLASTAAHAADGNIDPNAKGSIKIHKRESGSQNKDEAEPNGDNSTGVGVPGVIFTAYPIEGLDLSVQASWNELSGGYSVPANICDATPTTIRLNTGNYNLGAGLPSTTTTDQGEASIGDLSVKAYLVCETTSPSTVKKKAAPFIVTIPFPDNGSGTVRQGDSGSGNWIYDVHVYPKNTVVQAPTKGITVNGAGHGIKTGDQLTFPVEAKVPSVAEGEFFSYFVIKDDFSDNLHKGKIAQVEIQEAGQAAWTAVDPANYTKTADGTDPAVLSFTADGLTFLKSKPNAKIRVTFTAEVKSVPADGTIPNTATLHVDTLPTKPNTPNVPPTDDPGSPTNPVASNWGDLVITKQDKDNRKKLTGASFKVYNAQDPFAADCSAAVKATDDAATPGDESQPITIGGVDTFTTAADGTVKIDGLFIDSKVGAPGEQSVTPDNTKRCYILEEVAAPAGYVQPSGDAALTRVQIQAGTQTTDNVTIDNSKQTVPQLPLTGANGQMLLTIGGIALLLAAVGATFVSRRIASKRD
ncbi:SpaH/EbpB family LPXTG-anchored major pilin [Schaalia sp. 19OD2882]|uniref:SpaH/EbpB family LPXTG-anchored major pilin n=1 Tax=Schaalia sp. 19OD2882 TaxID=2794089 RepID=UPI001C1F0E3B|nr:SpaH/EbpB family LPXTG-anchored major pilin [Schaalia sp. 19OD2882]QWW19266.1 SpaH/EbpB family LPXTG-anchored major pilin [Schaalia sp. 19OD2882]